MDEYKQHGAAALARLLSEVLADPTQRKAFRENPQGKADELGIDISAMPPRVVAMLGELSGSEWRLLSELNHELIKGGLKVDTGDEGGGEGEGEGFLAAGSPVRTLGVF